MIRRRDKPDGLPFRVYERHGKRVYSIGYKMPSGAWAFRYQCPIDDAAQIATLRRKAVEESSRVGDVRVIDGFTGLVKAWFEYQDKMEPSDASKRADSTIAENRREAENLKLAFGHLQESDITATMGYEYLDACAAASRAKKGNKEIALASLILEYGIRLGRLETNPFKGLRKLRTRRAPRRHVTHAEMALAVEVGRARGGTRHIVAMALKTAWLCVRRSVEVRGITRDCVTDAGIEWRDGKDPTKPPVLIEWSDELRATVAEVLSIKRDRVAGTMYLFGNQRGQRYTKGGWKAVLDDLMSDCEALAAERKVEFRRFNLQQCRPMGVSDKLDRRDDDVIDATGHTSDRMVRQVYDQRAVKRAKPAA